MFANAPKPTTATVGGNGIPPPSFNAFIENIAGNVTAAAASEADNGNPWSQSQPQPQQQPQWPQATATTNPKNPFL